MIEPGKPKNTKRFIKLIKNNLGHRKLIPFNSVNKRVLKRRPIASTIKNEFVDSSA
jgi:adenine C2-methylase RlmN of 23S rRNA A2503 and tRNA A37